MTGVGGDQAVQGVILVSPGAVVDVAVGLGDQGRGAVAGDVVGVLIPVQGLLGGILEVQVLRAAIAIEAGVADGTAEILVDAVSENRPGAAGEAAVAIEGEGARRRLGRPLAEGGDAAEGVADGVGVVGNADDGSSGVGDSRYSLRFNPQHALHL
jgi:hypothetical protein